MDLGAFPPRYFGEDLNHYYAFQYKWQRSINILANRKPDTRSIYWIFDPIGGNGKSTLAKALLYEKKALAISWANSRDILYARSKNLDKNIILMDFTRSRSASNDTGELFSTIEQLKNGFSFSAKFESTDFFTAPPHIICFSNFLPPDPKLLSADRWKIYRIGNTSKRLIYMNFQQCNDFISDYLDFEELIQTMKAAEAKKRKKEGKTSDRFAFSYYASFFGGPMATYSPSAHLLTIYGD